MSATYRITFTGPPSALVGSALGEFGTFAYTDTSTETSTMVGTVLDDAALHGVLQRLQDLRADLLAVVRVDGPT